MNNSVVIVNLDATQQVNDPDAGSPILSPRASRSATRPSTPSGIVILSESTDAGSPVVSSNKKRRRVLITPSPKTQKSQRPPLLDEDDDGATCPICLDHWEMSGDHRLTSLKCGHLFGQSCIRRWLQECVTGSKCCPTCKTKATARDFRYLYAKKLCVVDNTETESLRLSLQGKTADLMKVTADKNMLDYELQHHRNKVIQLQEEIDYLKRKIISPSTSTDQSSQAQRNLAMDRIERLRSFKLFLEKNIDLSRESGCRCLTSSRSERLLFVSQKSSQNLFPGYGIRFIDLNTLKPSTFVHVSSKQIRDLVVADYPDNQSKFLLTATLENCGRMYDVTSRALVQTFKPTSATVQEQPLWCCAFEDNSNLVWFGGQRGIAYQFDKRSPAQQRQELAFSISPSPVINVAHVPKNAEILPFGGLLVCSLKELTFFQFNDASQKQATAIPISIEGPFSSMSYDTATGFALITTRSSRNHPNSRYIMGRIDKLAGSEAVTLCVKHTFLGSDVNPVMSKPVQYHVYGTESVLLSAYLQKSKMLTTWAVEHNMQLQSLSYTDTILDICSVYVGGVRHLATLSDNKCRIFKIHEERL